MIVFQMASEGALSPQAPTVLDPVHHFCQGAISVLQNVVFTALVLEPRMRDLRLPASVRLVKGPYCVRKVVVCGGGVSFLERMEELIHETFYESSPLSI